MKNRFTITSIDDIEAFCNNLKRMLKSSKKGLNISVGNIIRTTKQNNALHSTLTEYAQQLNDAGIPYRIKIGNKEIEGIWTLANLKDLFKIIAKHLYTTTSTTQLSTAEMSECYQVFAERISFNTGVHVIWHCNEPPDL
jgi:hypothetical protein